ncbi:MAG TPA: GWxTD domain-containing protein [bacterium]|jgi:GWxTD domain-containing protein
MKRFTALLFAALLTLVAAHRCHAGSTLDMDAAAFRASDSLGYVEVYTSVQRAGLEYRRTGDSLIADFRVLLEILKDNEVSMTDTFVARDVVDTTEARKNISGQYFAHAFRFFMVPGIYGIRASLYQAAPDARDIIQDTLRVSALTIDSLRVSDIELGSKLEFVKENSPFVKNGVLLIPNPARFYGTKLPVFYYYLETYGLDFDSAAVDSYAVFQRVVDAESGKLVRPETSKMHRAAGHTGVIADGFPVTTLRTGIYYLDVEVKSLRSGRSAVARKKFWTYRKEDLAAGSTFKHQPSYDQRVASAAPNFLEVVDADSAIQWMKYVLSRDEARQAKRLTPDGKRAFLVKYWKEKELEKPDAANQYFARIVEANRRYTFLKKAGWKTDRGRIFVLYGEPDRVVRGDVNSSTYDNETWEYDKLRGGVIFVFADTRGYGDLDMVHSTMPGETYNPNWNTITNSMIPRAGQNPR